MPANTDLRQVGEFIDFNQRQMVRGPKNPIDKATIVSIFPKSIDEVKHTIEPGKFHIDAGKFEDPAILVVGSSSWWKETDIESPLIEIPVGSVSVANSIIMDYCNGLLGCDMNNAMPGLFWIPGQLTKFEVQQKYKQKLEEVKEKQLNWYRILVRLADALWATSRGNPLTIWDVMRVAALELGFRDRPWVKDLEAIAMAACNACGNLRNPQFPVCPSCKAVDASHPLAKDLKFAQ